MSVYFIQAEDGGPIKIGYAADPESRIRSLQTGHHESLKVLSVLDGAGRDVETKLHERFRKHHVRGEWYRPHPDVIAYALALSRRDDQADLAARMADEFEACGYEDIDELGILDILASCGLVLTPGDATSAYYKLLKEAP